VRGTAVICHAHPRFGGSKDHPVLWQTRIALARAGLAVLSFNFRGVMGSEGSFGGGTAEVEDARAAIGFIRGRAAGPTFVVGWSFGANVALRASLDDDRVAALALLALPLGETSLDLPPISESVVAYDRPVLFLAGDDDPYCPLPKLRDFASRISGASVTVFEGTNHYFKGRERDAGAAVGRFAERALFSDA
jgi:alpha/beta superfamily hydrolase